MITFSAQELNLSIKDVQRQYKERLQGTYVKHPVIGDILITGTAFKETTHFMRKYINVLLKLDEIIKTSSCDGKLKPLSKVRKDDAIGFYYLRNTLQYGEYKINILVSILVDKQGNKYYMFTLNNKIKNENTITHSVAQPSRRKYDGGIIVSNNIINEFLKENKRDNIIKLGDCIELEIISKINESNDKLYYHGSNNKFDKFDKSKIKENKLRRAFNFTDDKWIAYQYGDNIITAKLDLNNPLTLDIWDDEMPYEWFNKFAKLFTNEPDYEYNIEDYKKHPYTIGKFYNTYGNEPEAITILEQMGYDGIALPEDHQYGVWEPEQIHIIKDITNEEFIMAKLHEKLIKTIVDPKTKDHVIYDDMEAADGMNSVLDEKEIKKITNVDESMQCDEMEDSTGMISIEQLIADMTKLNESLDEEASFAQLGTAPTPALSHVEGTTVNGVPVEGRSYKYNKKKKEKKNEDVFEFDDNIAKIENKLNKVRNEINNIPMGSTLTKEQEDLFKKRSQLEDLLARLKRLREKELNK